MNNGASASEAYTKTMENASSAAQELAKSGNVNIKAIQDFKKQQQAEQVATQAQSKSISNVRKLLNEYNSALRKGSNGLTDCKMKQDEFADAVNKSNQSLGGYLKNLNGAKASMLGYVKSITMPIVQTIATSVVIAGIMKAIQDFFSLIGSLVSPLFEHGEKLLEKFDKLKSELSDVNSELSSLKSELSNVDSQIDELLEKDELSFADEEELSRLQKVSSELEHQISLA